ncbi:hypothetical protein GDO86_003026 [Hymenochirus boettgeri]|uniref:Uncharacterized protein n=1 Tax=Hymenochirus boettgeri TaxID=247094 RepID=A0A8T2JZA1_9PIPI|nr:hypothetical protein GDO86_003026 [Hymenochirus boettgeri]
MSPNQMNILLNKTPVHGMIFGQHGYACALWVSPRDHLYQQHYGAIMSLALTDLCSRPLHKPIPDRTITMSNITLECNFPLISLPYFYFVHLIIPLLYTSYVLSHCRRKLKLNSVPHLF